MATGHGFWLTNRLVNPLRRLLRTPVGRRLGRGLLVLRDTGTATGRPHELVVQYARDGETVWILVGQPARKTWWHNLRQPADVDLWLAGDNARVRAVVVTGAADPDQAAAGISAY
jgi:F420H(2)-dependent quinone reductase